jgi:hypothetical protein
MSRIGPGQGGVGLARFLPLVVAAAALGVAAAVGPHLFGYDVRPGPLFGPSTPRVSAISEGAVHSAPGSGLAEADDEVPAPVAPSRLALPSPQISPAHVPPEAKGEAEIPPGAPSQTPGPEPNPAVPGPGARAAEVEEQGASPPALQPPESGQPPPRPPVEPPGPATQGPHADPHANGKGCDDVLFANGRPGTKGGPVGCEAGNSGGHRQNGAGGANGPPENGNACGRASGEADPSCSEDGKGKPAEPPGNPDPRGQARGHEKQEARP